MIDSFIARMNQELNALLEKDKRQWMESSIVKLQESSDTINDLLLLSASAKRILGSNSLSPDTKPLQITNEIWMPISHWSISDAGRTLLILQAIKTASTLSETLIRSYFEQGDESEVSAMVRTVNLIEHAELYKFYMREVGRTNSKPLYAALAQHNPYPARFYDQHEFNQLVLKALFIGLSIDPVIGLNKCANPELSNMCEDYIDERLAAGRSIPPDIWLALEPYASNSALKLIRHHLESEIPEHRYFSAKALIQQSPLSSERTGWLKKHLEHEEDSRILTLLSDIE